MHSKIPREFSSSQEMQSYSDAALFELQDRLLRVNKAQAFFPDEASEEEL